MFSKRDHARLDVLRLPYVPDVIAESDLVDGIFLYSAADRKRLLSFLKRKYADQNIRISKDELSHKRLPSRYSAVVFDHRYYLMYHGRKHNCHAGAGAFGVVKYLQDLETGEFDHVMKIFSEWHQAPGEWQSHHVEVGQISTYFNDEYEHLRALGEASASMPIWRHSQVKGTQLLQPQKTKKGINLEEFFKNYRRLHGGEIRDPQYILTIVMNMCIAVNKLHDQNKLLHRDIKLNNFIVNPQAAEVELIDFGFAISIDTVFDEDSPRLGTMYCVAPEIVCNYIPIYSKKSDAFALGAAIARAFEMDDEDTGRFPFFSGGKFIPKSLKCKTFGVARDPLLLEIYKICEKLLLADYVTRMDIPTALKRLKRLLLTCSAPVKVFAFNLADYIGLSDEKGIIEFLDKQKVRQIVLIVNEEGENNPAFLHAAIRFSRFAQQKGYIVHKDVVKIPPHSSNENILNHVANYLTQTSPSIKYVYSCERFVTTRQQNYMNALVVVIDHIPNRFLKKQYAEKFAALRESGVSVSQIVAEIKQLASAKNKSGPGAALLGFFSKNDALTKRIIDVMSHLDLNISFAKSDLSLLAFQLTQNKLSVNYK